MKAVRWHGRGDVRVDSVADPVANNFADCVVAVSLCGICGTDLAELRSGPTMISTRAHPLSGASPPVTLGHELVGTLVEGSSPDGAVTPGDRVTVDACIRCGHCGPCRRGDYHVCRYGGSVGLHMDGGFAPLVAVPGYTLVSVPDAVDDSQACLSEPFAVALHGLQRAGATPGSACLVFGFGPIGAASALTARAIGIEPWIVETSANRLAAAEELGFAVVEAGPDLPRRARRTIGDGGPAVVIESTGSPAVLPTAIDCTTRGGRIALLGLPLEPSQVDARRLTLFERSLVGSLGYREDLPRVLELFRSGRLDPTAIVGSVVGLDETVEAMIGLIEGDGSTIKVLVDTRG